MALRDVLKRQYEYAKTMGWLGYFAASASRHGFATADLLGIASRESNLKNIKGDFHDGIYHGYALMQLDINSHRAWIESGAWRNVEQAIERGAEALADKRDLILSTSKQAVAHLKFRNGKSATYTPRTLSDNDLRHCTLAAYNCGMASYYHFSVGHDIDAGTTGKDYGQDVIDRSMIFQTMLKADNVRPATKPALDQVPSPLGSKTSEGDTVQGDDRLSIKDVTNRVSTDSLKSVVLKASGKAGGPLAALWGAGVHGKLLIILAAALILGVSAYEIYKHRTSIQGFVKTLLRG